MTVFITITWSNVNEVQKKLTKKSFLTFTEVSLYTSKLLSLGLFIYEKFSLKIFYDCRKKSTLTSKSESLKLEISKTSSHVTRPSKISFLSSLDPNIDLIPTVRTSVRFRRLGIVKVQTLKLRVSICSEVRWLMNKSPFELVKLYFQIYTKNV